MTRIKCSEGFAKLSITNNRRILPRYNFSFRFSYLHSNILSRVSHLNITIVLFAVLVNLFLLLSWPRSFLEFQANFHHLA